MNTHETEDALPAIEAGDVVQIRSGSPVMTVVSVSDQSAHCLWYSETSGAIRTVAIPLIVLDRLEIIDEDLEEDEEEELEDEKSHGSKKKRKHEG